MATTILQQPTSPNGTITNLVYSVSSSLATQPQFKYVVDIYYSGSSDLLTRIKTSPNGFNTGIFDVAHILNDYLGDDNNWEITSSILANNTYKKFKLDFGEEYAPSISGSSTLYTSSATTDIDVFPAVVEPNDGSWNFPSASYSIYISTDTTEINVKPLTTFNFYSGSNFDITQVDKMKTIGYNDYETLSILNYSSSLLTSQPLAGVEFTLYDSNGNSIGDPSDPPNIIFGDEGIGILPTGPQNGRDYVSGSTIWNNDWYYYRVAIKMFGASGRAYVWYKKDTNNCYYEPTRFAFINKFGVWDYYSINLPNQRSTNVNRDNYISSFVNYSSNNSNYDINRRGLTQYNSTIVDRFNITTDWLDTPTANWLSELFESPSVYKQTSNGFVPINITSGEYVWKTNPRGQKTFQYNIEYVYSNNRRSRI